MKLKRFNSIDENALNDDVNKAGMPTKGLLVDVFKSSNRDDASAGGITSKVNSVVIVGPGIPEIFNVNEKYPAVYLDKIRDHVFASPVDKTQELDGTWMFGGNFIYSSDSRFSKLTTDGGPIPVHDRFEDWKTYDAMSK